MKKFLSKLPFTKGEIRVIVFIVAITTAGYAAKNFRSIFSTKEAFDFSHTDSVFSARSHFLSRATDTSGKIENQESRSGIADDTGRNDTLSGVNVKGTVPPVAANESEKMNINSATKEQLVSLPGIGEGIAGKIIAYRTGRGKFSKAEDIMKVSGIGKKKFEKLKELIKAE